MKASEIKESYVKERVKKHLKEFGAYWHMPVQRGHGAPALDFHVCHKGFYLGIETKRPGKHPTPRQELTIQNIRDAGGSTLVIGEAYDSDTGLFSGEEALVDWLRLRSL